MVKPRNIEIGNSGAGGQANASVDTCSMTSVHMCLQCSLNITVNSTQDRPVYHPRRKGYVDMPACSRTCSKPSSLTTQTSKHPNIEIGGSGGRTTNQIFVISHWSSSKQSAAMALRKHFPPTVLQTTLSPPKTIVCESNTC